MCGFLGMRVRRLEETEVLNGSLKKILLWGIVSKGRTIYITLYWNFNPGPLFSPNHKIKWYYEFCLTVEEIRP